MLKKFAQPIIIATILLHYILSDSGKVIDIRTIYAIEQCFWIVRQCLNMFPILLCHFLDSLQTLSRINAFLDTPEIQASTIIALTPHPPLFIAVDSSTNSLLPRKISLTLPTLSFGEFIVIKGPTGSGKSLFIKALLGEYSAHSNAVLGASLVDSVAYVGQDNWLMNKSIKDNIVLDKEFNSELFELVIRSLDLHRDIPDFSVIVNQRSDNLSGGQKQRVNLARSLY